MTQLLKDYVCRYLRTNASCRALFDRQLEVPGPELPHEVENRIAWRHADLFLAGFPWVGIRPGFDVLCHFTTMDPNRCSGLVGYETGAPEMVPDSMDETFMAIGEESADRMLFYGTALADQKILMVPKMPANWAAEAHEGGPAWLRHNINVILTDDGPLRECLSEPSFFSGRANQSIVGMRLAMEITQFSCRRSFPTNPSGPWMPIAAG